MILFEQGACKKIEAIRIFHYLQQIEKDWRTILCHPRLKKLLINEVLTVSPASAQLLEPYNNDYELTDEEFGTLVALCLNEPVTNDAEIMSFRKEVEDILYQKYHQKN